MTYFSQKSSITKGITEIALGDKILRNVFLFDEILVDISSWQLRKLLLRQYPQISKQ